MLGWYYWRAWLLLNIMTITICCSIKIVQYVAAECPPASHSQCRSYSAFHHFHVWGEPGNEASLKLQNTFYVCMVMPPHQGTSSPQHCCKSCSAAWVGSSLGGMRLTQRFSLCRKQVSMSWRLSLLLSGVGTGGLGGHWPPNNQAPLLEFIQRNDRR